MTYVVVFKTKEAPVHVNLLPKIDDVLMGLEMSCREGFQTGYLSRGRWTMPKS